MLYLLDEDKFSAIIKRYDCAYIFDEEYAELIRHYKDESEIDFKLENLSVDDIVCFHNSFPNEKNNIINRINFFSEEKKTFKTICFSLDSSFYQTIKEDHGVKIHKDRFYHNLKSFVDSGFKIDKILYGDYTNKNEANLISERIFAMLFSFSDNYPFDIKAVLPRDMKRLCELANYNYEVMLEKVADTDVGRFRMLITHLKKNI